MKNLDSSVVLAQALPAPDIDYGVLSPMLIVFGVAVVGVIVEAFAPPADAMRATSCWPSRACSRRSLRSSCLREPRPPLPPARS